MSIKRLISPDVPEQFGPFNAKTVGDSLVHHRIPRGTIIHAYFHEVVEPLEGCKFWFKYGDFLFGTTYSELGFFDPEAVQNTYHTILETSQQE